MFYLFLCDYILFWFKNETVSLFNLLDYYIFYKYKNNQNLLNEEFDSKNGKSNNGYKKIKEINW